MLQKLSVVTGIIVIVGVALWYAQGRIPSTGAKDERILSKLNTNQLLGIVIQNDEQGKVELFKSTNDQWRVKGFDYEADAEKIQDLLLQLLDTKLGEKVTEKTKHHTRFHLVHVSENNGQWQKEKTGKLLLLKGKEGDHLLEILLGKSRSDRQGFKDGQYLRYAGDSAVYLVADNIDASVEDSAWLDTSIVDIQGDELVKALELQHDGEVFRFFREKKEAEWKSEGVMEQQKIDQNAIRFLSNAMWDLRFDKIVPVETPVKETGREKLAHYTAELFDGRIVRINIGVREIEEESHHYLSIEMELPDDIQDEGLRQKIEEFNARAKTWLYGVQSWYGKRFLKKRSDLIGKEEEPE